MATVTDPARELGEIADQLTVGSNTTGVSLLSERFGVDPWSTDFVKIIVCIMERADLVGRIVDQAAMDEDHRSNAKEDLRQFKSAFTGNALNNAWNAPGGGMTLAKDHGRPLKYLSPVVRSAVAYPKLTDEEVKELIGLIDAYLEELVASDEGPTFVRQAISDGLTIFRFQLERIGWMGSGYALAAFREVMIAYEAAKRQYSTIDGFDAEAALKGLVEIVTKFKEKVDTAKGWAGAGTAVWKAYQLASSFATPLLLTGTVHISSTGLQLTH